jgi:hypothetical protein
MIFYVIITNEGYYCGLHRRWWNLFKVRPEFRNDILTELEAVTCFQHRQEAIDYLTSHRSFFPKQVEIRGLDLDTDYSGETK